MLQLNNTSLLEYLGNDKVERLVIVGMQTNVCVLSAVKDGIANKFEITVLSDAVAAKTTEVHNETLISIANEGAKIMTVDEYLLAVKK